MLNVACASLLTGMSRGRKRDEHHNGPCGPCVRCCNTESPRWFHGASLYGSAFEALQSAVPNVDHSSCVCTACHSWARRHGMRFDKENLGGEPATKTSRKECGVSNCNEPMLCSVHLTKERLSRSGLSFSNCQESAQVCSRHYRILHRQQNDAVCFLCKKRKLNDNKFYRPVNAQLLQRGDCSDVSKTALSAARLCSACHVKDIAEQAPEGCDSSLDLILNQLTEEIDQLTTSNSRTGDDVLQQAKATITLMVAKKLRGNEALLLADAFDELNCFLD